MDKKAQNVLLILAPEKNVRLVALNFSPCIVGGNRANFYLQKIRLVIISPHSDFILRGRGATKLCVDRG